MARTLGMIVDADEKGAAKGWIGDLPIDEAIEAVQAGRVRFAHQLTPVIDVPMLLAGLDVDGLAELHRLVELARDHECREVFETRRFPDDAGEQLVYECLRDRGRDGAEVAAAIEAGKLGDVWMGWIGPMLDRMETEIFGEPT